MESPYNVAMPTGVIAGEPIHLDPELCPQVRWNSEKGREARKNRILS